jgi:uncharacterized protein (TIGR03382 family)
MALATRLAALVALVLGPATALAEGTIVRYADDFARGSARRETVAAPAPVAADRARIAAGPRSLAVILFNFADDTSEPVSADEIRRVVFTGSDSASALHEEQSHGAVSFVGRHDTAGDVFGWYTIAARRAPCEVDLWRDQAIARAKAAGFDIDAYQHVMLVFPEYYQPGCEFGGLAEVGGRTTWIHHSQVAHAAAHELGHNLGLHHAQAYECRDASGTRVAIGGSCKRVEYGDPFDVMGSAPHQVNGIYKARLGYGEVESITAPGVYRLAPAQSDGGTRLIRVYRDTLDGEARYFYLETRRSQPGFDDFFCLDEVVNGVTVRLARDLASEVPSALIDTSPETESFRDAPLGVGETFTDAKSGISIRTLSIDDSGASVAISFDGELPAADHAPPAPDDGVGGDGLEVAWYGNRELSGDPAATGFIEALDFDWGEDAPAVGLPADEVSARFSGYLAAGATGTWAIHTASDDGIRVRLDGVPIIDDWTTHGVEGNVALVELEINRAHHIEIDYFEGTNGAAARLAWKGPQRACEIVPTSRLFTEPPDLDEVVEPEADPQIGGAFGGCSAAGGPGGGAAALLLLLLVLRRRR